MTENAESYYRKANAALAAGKLEQAKDFVKQAIRGFPQASQPLTLAAVIELNRNELEGAARYFREAIRLSDTGAEAAPNWVGWGRILLIQGDPLASLNCFNKACALVDGFAAAHAGKGAALMELGRYREGEQAARRALGLQDDPLTQLTLARCMLFQSRVSEAKKILLGLRAAQQVQFEVRFHWAGILKAEGDIEEAAKQFRALLQENPSYPGHYELAQCKTFLTKDDEDLKWMLETKSQLDKENLSREIHHQAMRQSDLCFSLGKAYDDLGEPDFAFGYWREGNRIHQTVESTAVKPVGDQVRRAGQYLTDFLLDRAADSSRRRESLGAPLWILCMPRAGASLLEQMLNGHSAIRSEGETNPRLQALKELIAESHDPGRQDFGELLGLLDPGEKGKCEHVRFVANKSPENFIYAPILSELVQSSKFINLRRHPLDSAFSQYTHLFSKGLGWTYSFEAIVEYHYLYYKALDRAEQFLGPRLCTIYYEMLVTDPIQELTRLLGFLGVDYEPNCLQYASRQHAVWTASNVQVRQTLNRKGIGRWKKYEKHMQPVIDGLASATTAYEETVAELMRY